jgi:hypothetical protein
MPSSKQRPPQVEVLLVLIPIKHVFAFVLAAPKFAIRHTSKPLFYVLVIG